MNFRVKESTVCFLSNFISTFTMLNPDITGLENSVDPDQQLIRIHTVFECF